MIVKIELLILPLHKRLQFLLVNAQILYLQLASSFELTRAYAVFELPLKPNGRPTGLCEQRPLISYMHSV